MRGGWRAGAAALAAALALAGCGGGGGSDSASTAPSTTGGAPTTAASGFCVALGELQRAAGDFSGLQPADASLDQLAEVAANLGAAWRQVRASLKDAPGVDTTALRAQWQRVLADAKQLSSGGATPKAAVTTLKADAAALKREADALASGCPSG